MRWPKLGEKLIAAKHLEWHWFTNVIENSKKLEIGKQYTIKSVDVLSSWCKIEIEEIDGWFSLQSFKWKY